MVFLETELSGVVLMLLLRPNVLDLPSVVDPILIGFSSSLRESRDDRMMSFSVIPGIQVSLNSGNASNPTKSLGNMLRSILNKEYGI